MKRKPGGRKNAFKHGAFARDLILTGETREDFERHHESLIEEWKPKGALEEDTVLTLAQGIWLKRRVERFYHQEATWAEEHPGEEELNYVDSLTRMLDHVQSFEEVTAFVASLPGMYKEWINSEYPRAKFNEAQSWIQSLKAAMPILIQVHELIVIRRTHDLSFKAEKAAQLRELTAKKIALDERLDSRIDKAIKRLAQLKALKQILDMQVPPVKGIEHRSTSDRRQ